MLNGSGAIAQSLNKVALMVARAQLPFNATLYSGAKCSPNNRADRFGFGQDISFAGVSYIFWLSDFSNQPNTSAIWTVCKQSSGCINYTAVPAW